MKEEATSCETGDCGFDPSINSGLSHLDKISRREGRRP